MLIQIIQEIFQSLQNEIQSGYLFTPCSNAPLKGCIMTQDVQYTKYYLQGNNQTVPRLKFQEKILRLSWISISLSLLTWPLFPPIMPNTRWSYYLPGAEAKATLGAIPMGLDATFYHYAFHPIKIYPPYHPVLPSKTMPPSPHRPCLYPPPPSK